MGCSQKIVIGQDGDGEVENSIRFFFFEGEAIVKELSEGCVEFRDRGGTEETFDLNSNFSTCFFGGDNCFCTEVDIHFNAPDFDVVGIMGNCPTVFFEGVFDDAVGSILSRHTFFLPLVTTQPVWWRTARTTTPCSHFSPRFARAEMEVLKTD
jgi:hypothetical protein